MGQDYQCGCRESAGHTFLCPFHQKLMEKNWEFIERDKHFAHTVNEANKKLRGVV